MTETHRQNKSRRTRTPVPESSPPEQNILNAETLYQRVKALTQSSGSLDQETAKLIIELADDAIKEFGLTNQHRKVELRKIKADAEAILPPGTIEELRKRAEGQLLQRTYPRHKGLRNILLLTIAIVSLSVAAIFLIRELRKSAVPTGVVGQNNSGGVPHQPTPEATNSAKPPEQQNSLQPPEATNSPKPPEQKNANTPNRSSTPAVQTPNEVSRYLSQCQSLFNQTEYGPALKECDKALSIEPTNQKALQLKVQIKKAMRILNR